MDELTLSQEDENGFRPPLHGLLRKYVGQNFGVGRNLPGPLGVFNHAWSEVEQALTSFLDSLDQLNRSASSGRDIYKDTATISLALRNYKSLIYEIVEFAEAIADELKFCCMPADAAHTFKVEGIKTLRSYSATICNKLKHNQNRMVFVAVRYEFGIAPGYAVCEFYNGALKPNREIHKDQQAFSFNTNIRRLLANAYLIAASLIGPLQEKADFSGDSPELKANGRTEALLQRVSRIPPIGFPDEKSRAISHFSFDGKTLHIRRSGSQNVPVGRMTQSQSVCEGDGETKTFPTFY